MNIPIAITGRNRFNYLLLTLKSLYSSMENPDIWYFDDSSTDKNLIRYITTDDEFKIIPYLWPKNDFWTRYIGRLPRIEEIKGIKNQIKIIRHEKQIGIAANGFSTITYMFNQYPKIECFFLIQDDIIFKYNWYEKMLKYISTYDLISGCMIEGYPTAQCYLLNRKFNNISYKQFIHKETGFDGRINEYITKNNLKMLNIHICQHIGLNSEANPRFDFYQKCRIDPKVFPPYCL